MRFLRIPTEQSDDTPELPAWIIDGLPAETPRLEAPRLEIPLPRPHDERRHEEAPAPTSTVIIIDW